MKLVRSVWGKWKHDLDYAKWVLARIGGDYPDSSDKKLALVTDSSVWIGDMWFLRSEPDRYVYATPFDGPWLRGKRHHPGKDYRSATDSEWDDFLKHGIHVRFLSSRFK